MFSLQFVQETNFLIEIVGNFCVMILLDFDVFCSMNFLYVFAVQGNNIFEIAG